MKPTLDKLYEFLKINRQYNKELQITYYNSIIDPKKNTFDRVYSLLYHIANTQSQPKIDKLAEFYQKIFKEPEKLNTFGGFMSIINPTNKYSNNYDGLFKSMVNQKGWGNKTSALLVKSLYHFHNGDYPQELKIWNDIPKKISSDDKLNLPVDIVIIEIFKRINKNNWNFNKINNELSAQQYKGKTIEIWDDLWFWGFITQNGTGNNRKMEWNLNKYWALKETNKEQERIDEIRMKSIEFLKIIT